MEEEKKVLDPQQPQEPEPHPPLLKPNIPIICAFLVVASAILPLLILHSNNTGMRFLEVLLPTVIILAATVILFFILWAILKKPLFAALCTATATLMAMNFHLFRRFVHIFFEGTASIWVAFFLWLGAVCGLYYVLIRIRKKPILPQIAQVICIAMAVLIAFNTIRIVPSMIKQQELKNYPSQSPEEDPALVSEAEMKTHTVEANGRNFYWIILDEYGDSYTMDTYFDYDCSAFLSYLKEKGFGVSNSSYANSNNSSLCAVDAVSLRYYSSEAAIRRENGDRRPTEDSSGIRRTGELYTVLKDLGYDIYQVSSHPGHYPVVKSLLPQTLMEQLMVSNTVDGLSVLDLAKSMSILSAPPAMFHDDDSDDDTLSAQMFNASFRSRILRVFDYYDDPQNICFRDKTALFTYVLCPHTPFVFDADGNNVNSKYRREWEDTSYYAAQYHYMTVKTQAVIENILSVDPDAVILLQSDHGVRGGYFINKGLEVEFSDQRRIFNALYIGGEPVDIEGLSAVNTLRYVLTYLGADYPPLSDEGVQPYYYQKQVDLMNEMMESEEDSDIE